MKKGVEFYELYKFILNFRQTFYQSFSCIFKRMLLLSRYCYMELNDNMKSRLEILTYSLK